MAGLEMAVLEQPQVELRRLPAAPGACAAETTGRPVPGQVVGLQGQRFAELRLRAAQLELADHQNLSRSVAALAPRQTDPSAGIFA